MEYRSMMQCWTPPSLRDGDGWIRLMRQSINRLHNSGIVWGDVKPNNVMIGPSGDAILIEFGGGEYVEMELQETKEGALLLAR